MPFHPGFMPALAQFSSLEENTGPMNSLHLSLLFFVVMFTFFRLNLRELGPLASHMRWFIWLMAAGGTIYVFLYHEK